MANGYGGYPGVSPAGYGPMQYPASGFANFMTGALPGLDRTATMLAQLPLIQQQAQEMERERALKSMQTLNEAMQLAPNLRGPYLDYIAPHLGLPDATVKMFKKMNEEQIESARRAIQGLKVPPEMAPMLLQEAVKNPSKLVEMYNAQTKREAQEKKDRELREIFTPSPAGAGTPPPPAPPGVAAAPAEAPLDEVVRTAQDPTLGPSAALPRLRGALRALDEAEAAELERIKAQQDKLAKLYPEDLKNYDAHFNSVRATVKDTFAVRRTAIQERLKKLDPEPLTDVAKTFKDRAAAVARNDDAQVKVLDAEIEKKGRPEVTALQADTQGTVQKNPWEMTSEDWVRHADIKARRANEYAAAGAKATAQAKLGVPERPTGTERDKLTDDVITYDQSQEIRGLYKPAFVGPVRGRIPGTALSVAGRALPGEADFRGALAIYRNRVINALSGAAVSATEAARMQQQIPQETDPPEMFEAKLRQTEQNLYRVAQRRRQTYGQTGVDLGGLPPLRPPGPEQTPLDTAREKLKRLVPSGG